MLALIVVAAVQSVAPRVAADLKPGMQLHYSTGDQLTTPWTVDSVESGVALMPGADCARVTIRRGEAAPNESRYCVRRDTMYAWDARRNTWTPQRPVAPRMTMVHARAGGDTVRYVTDSLTYQTISGVRLPVLQTTVLTVDSLGRPKRRLREGYALTLATATGGIFEAADGTGGWRLEQMFDLRRLIRP